MGVLTNFVILFLCAGSMRAQDDFDDRLIVQIKNGLILGKHAQTEYGTPYYAFQGIPYAEPPIGELRFRAPVPAKSWRKLIRSRTQKNCIGRDMIPEPNASEDCLYINVFKPANASKSSVMFWIYGKNDANIQDYGPDYFVEENVIVVTFNYRMGIFGFLSTEDSASPGNYGLKDQILALKWTYENIEEFGGDPESITIFGENEGAASVSYLIQTPLTRGLFRRAIMQSGTSINIWALTRNAKKLAFALGKALGITTDDSTHLLDALRNIEPEVLTSKSLLTHLKNAADYNPRDGQILAPTLEPENEYAVITNRSHELLEYGEFNKVPCIVGFNSEEGIPFKEIIDYVRPHLIRSDIFFTKLIPLDMNIESNIKKGMVGVVIKQKYFGLLPIGITDESLVEFVTDDQFVRPIYEYVNLLSIYVPVYFYRFSHAGELGSQGKQRKFKGVANGEELYYMWRRNVNVSDPAESDIITRHRLVKLWTNFAKTSNPTPEKDELFQDVLWPAFFPNLTYFDIGHDIQLMTDMTKYKVDFWKALYTQFGVPPFDTY